MEISWKEEYRLNLYFVDSQHKNLFDLFDELLLIIEEKRLDDLQSVIGKLDGYAKVHFATEEDYFDKYAYPELEEHKKQHQEFIREVEKLQNKYNENPENVQNDIVHFMRDWFINHVTKSDIKYAPFIKELLDKEKELEKEPR